MQWDRAQVSDNVYFSAAADTLGFFLPRSDLKTIVEMKNAPDISMCVPHSVYLGGIFRIVILYALERHPY